MRRLLGVTITSNTNPQPPLGFAPLVAADAPWVKEVIWEEEGGVIVVEDLDEVGGFFGAGRKKIRRRLDIGEEERLLRSGDGTIPYLSLAWAHTWLLDFERGGESGVGVGDIVKSHREEGGGEWKVEVDVGSREMEGVGEGGGGGSDEGEDEKCMDGGLFADTIFSCGVKDVHKDLTNRDPAMEKWKIVSGDGRTTTVIEAHKIEHKETPRNAELLNAVLEEVLWISEED